MDSARLTVLCAIPALVQVYGDVPIQAIMYAFCGHTGSKDVRCSTDDPAWDLRNNKYDTIMPDDIREQARLERVQTKDDLTQKVARTALSIVAMSDEEVLKRMSVQLSKQRAVRQANRARLMEGYVSDESDRDVNVGTAEAPDAAETPRDIAHTESLVDSDSDEQDMNVRMGMM